MTLCWIYTVVEIFYQDEELASPAPKSDTFPPTELEIFWPDFVGKALVLVNPDALTERLSTVQFWAPTWLSYNSSFKVETIETHTPHWQLKFCLQVVWTYVSIDWKLKSREIVKLCTRIKMLIHIRLSLTPLWIHNFSNGHRTI